MIFGLHLWFVTVECTSESGRVSEVNLWITTKRQRIEDAGKKAMRFAENNCYRKPIITQAAYKGTLDA